MLDFKKIHINDRKQFIDALSKIEYENSEFSFANIFIWKDIYDIKLCKKDGAIYISAVIPETKKYVHFQPICPDESNTKKVLNNIKEDFTIRDEKFCIASANDHCIEKIKNNCPQYNIEEIPNMYDYVYLATDLSELEGKKYHKKRTHINHFLKENSYEYKIIDKTNKNDCLIIFDKWVDYMGQEFKSERSTIENALDNMEKLELFGAIIYINNEPVAFTMAESFLEDTALIHIEKAVPEHRDVYATINQQFAKRELASKYKYINREEDMGIEGIRRAKKSYYPCKMIKKYDIYEK